MTETFKFDWHENRNGFLGWLVVALVESRDLHDLGARSDQFRNVELGITINGVPMDAERLVQKLERVLEHRSKVEAARMIEHADTSRLTDTVDAILSWTKDEMLRTFAEKGIDLPEEVW